MWGKVKSDPMATFRSSCFINSEMLRGGWEFQEGTAVGFLLVWCGRSATTLVAAGHKVHKYKTKKHLNPGSKALPG
ncbi:hypothetical protein EGC86_20435 [Shewanella frigidimarina]|nr:hypothetical protein EGC86_20435 [Shewanella frigidimarina]